MTIIEQVLAWAPPYPETWTAPEAHRAIGRETIPKGRVAAVLRTASKYGLVEEAGTEGRATLWRLPRPEGAPECTDERSSAPDCRHALAAWVRTLAPGREFTIPEAVEACAPFSRSRVIEMLKEHPGVTKVREGSGRRNLTVYRRGGQ